MDFMISSAGCAWDLQCFNGSCMCFVNEKSLPGLVILLISACYNMSAWR